MYRKRALLAITCLSCITYTRNFWLSPSEYLLEKMATRNKPKNDGNWDSFNPDATAKSGDAIALKEQVQEDQVVGSIPTEVEDIVDYLRDPEQFRRFGVKMPKGVLFVGPPGTGKTCTARAIAREAGAYFISSSGSEFVNMYVGVGASNVRKLFAEARSILKAGIYKAVIIFIDEIDALGAARTERSEGGNSEYNQTVNQLLTELDGFRREENILVIAATNFEDTLDSALLRPGRFDRRAYFKLPGEADRLVILQHYCKNRPVDPEIDLVKIAQVTDEMSGADLKNIVNEAAIEAVREKGNTVIAQRHFDVALQKAMQRSTAHNRSRRSWF